MTSVNHIMILMPTLATTSSNSINNTTIISVKALTQAACKPTALYFGKNYHQELTCALRMILHTTIAKEKKVYDTSRPVTYMLRTDGYFASKGKSDFLPLT